MLQNLKYLNLSYNNIKTLDYLHNIHFVSLTVSTFDYLVVVNSATLRISCFVCYVVISIKVLLSLKMYPAISIKGLYLNCSPSFDQCYVVNLILFKRMWNRKPTWITPAIIRLFLSISTMTCTKIKQMDPMSS